MIEDDLPTVRLLVVGGEDCPAALVSQWAPGRRMLNTYGPTEATVVATLTECIAGKPVTIGRALPGYAAYVLDDDLRPVTCGEIGELFIGGPSVARGYLNRSELTCDRFIPDTFDETRFGHKRLYRTYDLVRWTSEGELQFVGRKDSLVKIRGFRVELSEIDTALSEQPAVRAAASPYGWTAPSKNSLRSSSRQSGRRASINGPCLRPCASGCPNTDPEIPDAIQELPRLTSGKLDRNQLPPSTTLLASGERESVCAQTALERDMVEVFQTCLGVSPIFVGDDFFTDLGGHSLLAARVVTALRAKFNTSRIGVRDIYEHRTIRQLCDFLGSDESVVTDAPASPPVQAMPPGRGHVSGACRWLCATLQAVALLAYHAIIAGPAAVLLLTSAMAFRGEIDLWDAVAIMSTVSVLTWPCWLALSIALKWLVIGRYKPGRYPLWGSYYFRWWLVSRFQGLSWSGMFVGTPLMSLYYRAMGAKVGRNSTIGTPLCSAFDVVSIGADTSVGAETQLLGYRVEDGWLVIGQVTVGDRCFVGAHSNLALNVTMGDGARLDDMSLLPDGGVIPPGAAMSGSPASTAAVCVPGDGESGDRPHRRFLFGLLHLTLIYCMGYLLLLSMVPGWALVLFALSAGGAIHAAAATFAAVPLAGASYLAIVIAVKRIAIGRISPGVYRGEQRRLSPALVPELSAREHTADFLLPLYATLLFPKVLRLLGAKIGKNVEVSTVMHVTPDLLQVADGSFLADACLIGGQRAHGGFVEVLPNRIGERTFIGNSAHVRGGIEIGNDSLIGVMSTPPVGISSVPDSTRWLGSPSFVLPGTQAKTCFAETSTYRPSKPLIAARIGMEVLRVLLPAFVLAASLVAFAGSVWCLAGMWRGLSPC